MDKRNYRLPRLIEVQLRNFSLFTRSRTVTVDFTKAVTCLAGANGIGKSTFVAAVLHGLTGCVPTIGRQFYATHEYLEAAQRDTDNYFTGRISELDRDGAEIIITFSLAGYEYQLTRGMFETANLRDFKKRALRQDEFESVEYDDSYDAHTQYTKLIEHETGFDGFDQFVFVQHQLLTFDERRLLTFWDTKLLQQLLFFAFGVDASLARREQEVRRNMERAESRGRNFRYQMAVPTRRRNDLLKAIDAVGETPDEITAKLSELDHKRNDTRTRLDSTIEEMNDTSASSAALAAKYVQARNRYNETYESLDRRSRANLHPVIDNTIRTNICGICGHERSELDQQINALLDQHKCPLCLHPISSGPLNDETDNIFPILSEMDQALSEIQLAMRSEHQKQDRLTTRMEELRDSVALAEREFNKYVSGSGIAVFDRDAMGDQFKSLIDSLNEQREALQLQSHNSYQEAAQFRATHKQLQKDLMNQYQTVEIEFVPIFTELARSFLGRDISVEFEQRSGGISLVLHVDGTARRYSYQLSESQRYFLDIALRMALAQFMTEKGTSVTLFIDTPEGSLDAAYESRAGRMFSAFALPEEDPDNAILITANINTSALLRRLATQCTHKNMNLVRMIEWTELSEVQKEEQDVFDEAYKEIEAALNSAENR